jgi:hypothetical protein
MSLNLLRPMIDKSWFERKKTGMPTEREEDGRRRKKGIDIHSGGRKRNGISLLFLQAPLMEFQDVADTFGKGGRDLSMQEGVCVSTGTDVRGSAINPPCKGSARALLTNE